MSNTDIAFYQLILSGFGVLGLGLTVHFARRAWKEAQRSANAAHEALRCAREDAAAQESVRTEQLQQMASMVSAMGQLAQNTYRI